MAFETDATHFKEDAWSKKLGKKLGAGFLITGTISKMSKHLKIHARMIDIVKGSILSGSSCKIRFDEIDETLISDYIQKKKPSKPTYTQKDPDFNNFEKENYPDNSDFGNFCCDQFGIKRCQLFNPVIIGSPCFCAGQGWGVTCR